MAVDLFSYTIYSLIACTLIFSDSYMDIYMAAGFIDSRPYIYIDIYGIQIPLNNNRSSSHHLKNNLPFCILFYLPCFIYSLNLFIYHPDIFHPPSSLDLHCSQAWIYYTWTPDLNHWCGFVNLELQQHSTSHMSNPVISVNQPAIHLNTLSSLLCRLLLCNKLLCLSTAFINSNIQLNHNWSFTCATLML